MISSVSDDVPAVIVIVGGGPGNGGTDVLIVAVHAGMDILKPGLDVRTQAERSWAYPVQGADKRVHKAGSFTSSLGGAQPDEWFCPSYCALGAEPLVRQAILFEHVHAFKVV